MSKFAKGFATATVLVAGAGLIYILATRPTGTGGDDQPPIIVGDGSMDVLADYDVHNHGRGEFERDDPGNRYKWHYRDAAGAPTSRVDVVLLDGIAGSSGDCENPDKPFENLKEMTVTYDPSATVTVTFDPSVGNKFMRLLVAFSDGLAVDAYKPYWLRVPNIPSTPPVPPSTTPIPPVIYTLKSVSMKNQAGTTMDCTLSYTSQLKLIQLK